MSDIETPNQQLMQLHQRVRYAVQSTAIAGNYLSEFNYSDAGFVSAGKFEQLTKTIVNCIRTLAKYLFCVRQNAAESRKLLDVLISRRRKTRNLELLLCFDSKQMKAIDNPRLLHSYQGLPSQFVVPFSVLNDVSFSQTSVAIPEERSADFTYWWESKPGQVQKQFHKYFAVSGKNQCTENSRPLCDFYKKHNVYKDKIRTLYDTVYTGLDTIDDEGQRARFSLTFAEAALTQLSSNQRVVVLVTDEESLLNFTNFSNDPLLSIVVARPAVITLVSRMLETPNLQIDSGLELLLIKAERLCKDADQLIRDTSPFVDASEFANENLGRVSHAYWNKIASNNLMDVDMLSRLFGDLDRLYYSCREFEKEWGYAIASHGQKSHSSLYFVPSGSRLPRVPRDITVEGGTELKKQTDLTLICNIRTTNCESLETCEVITLSDDPVRICCFDGEDLMFAFTAWTNGDHVSHEERDSTMLQLEFTPRKPLGDLWDKALEVVVHFMKVNHPHEDTQCNATFEKTIVSFEFESEEKHEVLTQLKWSQLNQSAMPITECPESSPRPQRLQAVELMWSRLAIYVQEFEDEPERLFSISFPHPEFMNTIATVLMEILSFNDPTVESEWLAEKVSDILSSFSENKFTHEAFENGKKSRVPAS